MNAKPKLRSPLDRARQVILFEVGGLILVTPPFAWASGVPAGDSIGLLALIALIAALWNGAYTTSFDWFEGRWSGRTADQRTTPWRVVHATGFELGLLLISLPIVMAWTSMGWLDALAAEGSLNSQVPVMQTRARLYELLDYEGYNSFDNSVFNFTL